MSFTRMFAAAGLVLALTLLISLTAMGRESQPSAPTNCLVYVGTYTGAKSRGIYLCHMNLANGFLSPAEVVATTSEPTFLDLDPHGKFLFAANEIGRFDGKPEGAASAFAIKPGTGKLTPLNQRSTVGAGPAHIVVDTAGQNALCANYGDGSVAVMPIQPDGRLGEASDFIQYTGRSIDAARQEKSHAHGVTLDAGNRFAYVCDLGTDKIMVYRYNAARGKLTPAEPPFFAIKPGAGPRHLALHPNGRFAYLINELNSTITVLARDPARGGLKEIQTLPTLPVDFTGHNTAAEIAVSASGKFVYASNRGHDSIAIFAVDQKKGVLTPVEWQSTQGKTPRHFAIDPTGRFLIAANQESDSLVIFSIDAASGRLKPTGQTVEIPAPTCVRFLPVANR